MQPSYWFSGMNIKKMKIKQKASLMLYNRAAGAHLDEYKHRSADICFPIPQKRVDQFNFSSSVTKKAFLKMLWGGWDFPMPIYILIFSLEK